MKKIAFAVHGGASDSSHYLRRHIKEYEAGLSEATLVGYQLLKNGGNSIEAVIEAIKILEDNPLFNAGRGSALNCKGEVEMDASIMEGKKLNCGAVSMVRSVKNPIVLADIVMNKTKHVFFSGYGALLLAQNEGVLLEKDSYFITEYQYEIYKKLNKIETVQNIIEKKIFGTVGAVALDKKGNLAAGTSTGGTSNCLPGRIGDSCVIGAGCYANNRTCAVSGTGEGERLIRGVVGHSIAVQMEFTKMSLQAACDYVLHERNKNAEIGVISVNQKGEIGICFNTKIFKRAWVSSDNDLQVKIY